MISQRTSALFLVAAVMAAGVSSSEAKKSATEEFTFKIDGMKSEFSISQVSSAFRKCPGVVDAMANQGQGTAKVRYNPAQTDPDQIIAAFKGVAPRFTASKPVVKAPEPPPSEKSADKTDKKKGMMEEEEKYVYNGQPETLNGKIAIRAPDSPKDVPARLVAHRSGEKLQRVFNMIATGDMAVRIEEMRKVGFAVNVTGVVSEAGIKVTKIE